MLIIFNPTAGQRRGQQLERALATLRRSGCAFSVTETRHAGHAGMLARAGAAEGRKLVVAAGGDGTIAEVAAGLVDTDVALGVLPFGTANVFAWEVGIPLQPEAAAGLLVHGTPQTLHLGQANFADGTVRMFVQMVGAGFDAAVVFHLDLGLKQRVGRWAYVWQAVRELSRYRFPPIRVVLGDENIRVGSVIATRGRLYAGRHVLAPAAQMMQPGFQVALFHGAGAMAAAAYGAALPLNLLPRMPGFELRHAMALRIEGEGVAVQADGDPASRLPVDLQMARTPIRVLLPGVATGGPAS